ncbi:hypothetical protein ACQ4PT_064720 [Festuca glaucescens]
MSTSRITVEQLTGSHTLVIENYSSYKHFQSGFSAATVNFTAAGHNWTLQYYPKGITTSFKDYVSIYLILKGGLSVRAEVKFSLVGAKEGGSKNKTVEAKKVANEPQWACEKLIKRKDLEKSKYLDNNSFKILCEIVVFQGTRAEAVAGSPQPEA